MANTRFFTFDLDPGGMVTQSVAQYPPHHVTYAPVKFEVATSKDLGYAFTRKFDPDHVIKVSLNIAQGPLYHVTYAPAKFEVSMRRFF